MAKNDIFNLFKKSENRKCPTLEARKSKASASHGSNNAVLVVRQQCQFVFGLWMRTRRPNCRNERKPEEKWRGRGRGSRRRRRRRAVVGLDKAII